MINLEWQMKLWPEKNFGKPLFNYLAFYSIFLVDTLVHLSVLKLQKRFQIIELKYCCYECNRDQSRMLLLIYTEFWSTTKKSFPVPKITKGLGNTPTLGQCHL